MPRPWPGRLRLPVGDRFEGVCNGVIVGVAQTRGGIGATTLAVNLATLLAQAPKRKRGEPQPEAPRVVILDLDFQNGNLGSSIDVPAKHAVTHWLREDALVTRALLRDLLQPHPAGFGVLSAPAHFVPLDAMRRDMMASLLGELRLSYDYVILDLPRAMVGWLEPVLTRADKTYILSDTAVHSVRQARRMIDFYSEDHVALPVQICVSLEKKPFTTSQDIKEAEKFLDQKLRHWLPRDDRAARAAADRGQPLLAAKPRSSVAKAIKPLADELRAYSGADHCRQA